MIRKLILKSRRRQRRKRSLRPLWPGVAEGYAINQMRANLWRMHDRETLSDLVNEAWLIYKKIHSRYARETDSPKWLMALFAVALQNRITDLARKSSRRSNCEVADDELVNVAASDRFEPIDSVLQLITAIENAPSEIRAALLVLLNAPDELLNMIQAAARRSPRRASRIMCYLIGQQSDNELWSRARHYLTEKLQ